MKTQETPNGADPAPSRPSLLPAFVFQSLWSADLTQPLSGPLATLEDLLLLPTRRSDAAEQSATLHALDLSDGGLRWRMSFKHGLISGLATTEDDLIVVSLTSTDLLHGAGMLLGLDAAGQAHWRWPSNKAVQRVSAPTVTDDTVVFSADARTLVVLDLATAEEQARVSLEASAALSAPALAEGVAYIPCRGPHLLAVGLDGEMRWHFPADDGRHAWLDKTPVVIEDRLFAVLSSGAVLALQTEDGSLAWRADVGPTGRSLTPPATDGEHLYVGARDGLHALDPLAGAELWHFPTERRVEAAPVAHGGIVYAACHDHHLYALHAASGRELWRYEVERRIEIAPVLAHSGQPPQPSVVVVDRGGIVTAVTRPLNAEEHEAVGNWLEAARLRAVLGQQERAAELYERAGAWQKAAELWCALEHPLRQARALEAFARSLDERTCGADELAAAWEAAARAFEAEGEWDRAADCRAAVARCLELPIITVDVEIERGLVLDAWSRLRFIVRNEGFGPARNLIIRAEGEQFEGQVTATRRITTLRSGRHSVEWLDVRPRAYGDSVPLRVRVEYQDRTEAPHSDKDTIYIPVAPVGAERQEGQTYSVFVKGKHMDHERGLDALEAQLEQTSRYLEFETLEARLRENLHDERLYGTNETVRSGRARIINSLNRLALEVLGISYNDLALGRMPEAGQISSRALSLVQQLSVAPTPTGIKPPVESRLQDLPFNALSWEQFEAVCAALVEAQPVTLDCHLYGVQGDFQHGIDIVATQRGAEENETWAYQCKRYERYTPGKLREALDTMTYPADYFVLMLSIDATVALRQISDENDNVFLWDAKDIARKLKNYPVIVQDFFGKAWRDAFCGR